MGVKVPVLSPPPPKDPNYRSSLYPGCYHQRAVRRAKKVSSRGRSSRGAWPTEQSWMQSTSWEQQSSSSSILLHASRQPLLRQVYRTTMEVLDDGSSFRLAAETTNVRLAGVPCLFCPVPSRGRRLVRYSSAVVWPVLALHHDLDNALRPQQRSGGTARIVLSGGEFDVPVFTRVRIEKTNGRRERIVECFRFHLEGKYGGSEW